MECPRCDELLAAYKHSVGLFTTAQRKIRGLVGDDFQRASKELVRLYQKCMDANAAVTAHWRQDHQRAGD
jgi:hypothetical protein